MKQRFYIYRRGETIYLQDSRTGKQQSLETKDRNAAFRCADLDADAPFPTPGKETVAHLCPLVTQPRRRTGRRLFPSNRTQHP